MIRFDPYRLRSMEVIFSLGRETDTPRDETNSLCDPGPHHHMILQFDSEDTGIPPMEVFITERNTGEWQVNQAITDEANGRLRVAWVMQNLMESSGTFNPDGSTTGFAIDPGRLAAALEQSALSPAELKAKVKDDKEDDDYAGGLYL